jgi:hypothetical protein
MQAMTGSIKDLIAHLCLDGILEGEFLGRKRSPRLAFQARAFYGLEVS